MASEACSVAKPFSNGVFYHENPLEYAFPLLMLHIVIIGITTHIVYFLLRPLRQPRFVCDFIGGAIASHPTFSYLLVHIPFLAHGLFEEINEKFQETIFRPDALALLRVMSAYGIMIKFFLIGVKIDPANAWRGGWKPFFIGLCSMLVPMFALWASFVWLFKGYEYVNKDGETVIDGVGQPKMFIDLAGTACASSSYVMADTLTDLKLLSTELGRLAISASMTAELARWTFFGIRQVVDMMTQAHSSVLVILKVQVLPVVIVLVILVLFRLWMRWILKRTPNGGRVAGWHILMIMLAVMATGVVSDALGLGFLDVPMLMGLMVPNGPPLGMALVERLDLIATEVLQTLFFFGMGLKTNFKSIKHYKMSMFLLMLMIAGHVFKVLVTLAPAIYYKMSLHKATMLGLMLNFKGLVEVIVFLNLMNVQLLTSESFVVITISMMLTTGICSLVVSTCYDPLKTRDMVGYRALQHLHPHEKFSVVASMLNEDPVPILLNLIEASSVDEQTAVCIFALHLVELGGRANSSLISHRNRSNGDFNTAQMNRLLKAFINYEKKKDSAAVVVHPFTAICPYITMHQDICSLAMEKNVPLTIVPFPRKDVGANRELDNAARSVVPHVLLQSPCSVGILVHHALTSSRPFVLENFRYRVRVLFWGGNDDREALSYARRMARHAGVQVSVTRFLPFCNEKEDKDLSWDEMIFKEFARENVNNERVMVEEVAVRDIGQTISAIKAMERDCDLVMVGRRKSRSTLLDEAMQEWMESPELGAVGDMLASSDFADSSFSVLVIQQHDD
ncbi:cation/H(+) antiporter 15-like [Canna indica]|uniref:Cation/H(+) antiporter 15-like n=1 Tax=Canna indica TaxID=4628 RepID=A0AAQ3QC38_9LILI|nr:cation/H(+) antiporter 15-like [Canna indica]